MTTPADPARFSAAELVAAAAIILAAALLRFWSPASMGIEHYDEGVYVISALGLTDPGLPDPLFTDQRYFSPPLYFGMVAAAGMIFGGPLDVMAVLVSALFGTLTVVLVWWAGRTWFGPPAGLAAAALLAFSEYHIELSRSALTDAAYAFFLLLAVVLIERALGAGSLWLAGCAGLAAGLAWNTKYHGWLALALGAAGWLIFAWQQPDRAHWRRSVTVWSVIVVVALAAYAPWAWYVHTQPGGYAGLTRWQGVFFEGDWLGSFKRHVAQQRFLDGPWTDGSILIAAGVVVLIAAAGRLSWLTAALCAALGAAAWLVGGWAVMHLLAFAGLIVLARGPTSLAAWISIVYMTVLVALTPLYHPYARLLLPIPIMVCLLCGLILSQALAWSQRERRGMPAGALLCLLAAACYVGFSRRGDQDANPWRPARGAADAAAAIAREMPLGSRVKVIEEPEVAFYLHQLGFDTLRSVQDKEIPPDEPQSCFVVTGFYGTAGLAGLGRRVIELGSFPMIPKDLRLVDDLSPPFISRARGADEGEHDLLLFKVVPAGSL